MDISRMDERLLLTEALRYSGVPRPDERQLEKMAVLLQRVRYRVRPASVWKCFDAVPAGEDVLLVQPGILLPGHTAGTMLKGCDRAAVMVCTLGASYDALLREYEARDMAEALLLNGLGSALV